MDEWEIDDAPVVATDNFATVVARSSGSSGSAALPRSAAAAMPRAPAPQVSPEKAATSAPVQPATMEEGLAAFAAREPRRRPPAVPLGEAEETPSKKQRRSGQSGGAAEDPPTSSAKVARPVVFLRKTTGDGSGARKTTTDVGGDGRRKGRSGVDKIREEIVEAFAQMEARFRSADVKELNTLDEDLSKSITTWGKKRGALTSSGRVDEAAEVVEIIAQGALVRNVIDKFTRCG